MNVTEATDTSPPHFSHEALFYKGARDYAERTAAFVGEGLSDGEPVLVMVPAEKSDLVRAELGDDASRVMFVDMREAGRNPGRIISAWNDFASEHVGEGQRARGIGEPIWPGRTPDELVECQHHEALINLAFEDAHGFRLMCPYDTEGLPEEVLEEAYRSHPLVLDEDAPHPCDHYCGADAIGVSDEPLPPPRSPSREMGFQQSSLPAVRRFVAEAAAQADLSPARADDLILAVNEAAGNSVVYGGGEGMVRVWSSAGSLVCEIRDRGRFHDPLVGRRRPARDMDGGRGLWLAHQLCDLVQLRSWRRTSAVRLHMRIQPD